MKSYAVPRLLESTKHHRPFTGACQVSITCPITQNDKNIINNKKVKGRLPLNEPYYLTVLFISFSCFHSRKLREGVSSCPTSHHADMLLLHITGARPVYCDPAPILAPKRDPKACHEMQEDHQPQDLASKFTPVPRQDGSN